MKIFSLIIFTVVLSGCVPWPHIRHHTPQFEGVLTENGKPLPGAMVKLSTRFEDEECENFKAETTTDIQGRFLFRRRWSPQLFMFIGDPVAGWTICAYGDEGVIPLTSAFRAGFNNRKSMGEAYLVCEIGEERKYDEFVNGYCK